MGSDVAVQRGIYTNLIDSYNLEGLREIKSRADFVKALPKISSKSKKFFILSSQYFDTAEAGFVQLLGPLQKFATPQLLGGLDLTIDVPKISFTAWVIFICFCLFSEKNQTSICHNARKTLRTVA